MCWEIQWPSWLVFMLHLSLSLCASKAAISYHPPPTERRWNIRNASSRRHTNGHRMTRNHIISHHHHHWIICSDRIRLYWYVLAIFFSLFPGQNEQPEISIRVCDGGFRDAARHHVVHHGASSGKTWRHSFSTRWKSWRANRINTTLSLSEQLIVSLRELERIFATKDG